MLPKTSVDCYVSGMHSINLDLKDGTGVGWHYYNYWKLDSDIKLYGKGMPVDITRVLGNYGVEDRSSVLGYSIFIADHTRAAVDLVYESLIKWNMIGEIRGMVDDIFLTREQQEEFFSKLLLLVDILDNECGDKLERWVFSRRLQERKDKADKSYIERA